MISSNDSLGNVCRVRRTLDFTRAAIARGKLTVGFLGGSITEAKTGTRWPEPFVAWLAASNPGLQLLIENAAIGATGSDLAVFHAQRDIIERECDLVFVEFSVNDANQESKRRQRTREGLIRQLIKARADVIIVHAFRPEMLSDMHASRVPASIAEFESIAEYYGLNSVWMGLHSWREVKLGMMKWSEWLPDGLHPEERGSLSYAQSVISLFSEAMTGTRKAMPSRKAVPVPLDHLAWERVSFVPFSAVRSWGPWTIRRGVTDAWMHQMLYCTAQGARLQFNFNGRGLVVGSNFGHASGEFRYRVDKGRWKCTQRERFAWHGQSGWLRPTIVADNLENTVHSFELESIAAQHGGSTSAQTALTFFGVIR